MIHEETPRSNQIGCDRALRSSNWGTSELSNNPEFPWQTQCNSLVLTLLLGLGFRVLSLFGLVFCYHKIINIQSFFICSCTFIYSQSFACLFFVAIKWYRSDNESCEGNDTEDPSVNFEQLVNQVEDGEDEALGLPPDLKRMVEQEDREVKPHQEEIEVVNLNGGEERKEVKVGTGMSTNT